MKFKKIILLFIALQFFYTVSNAQIKLVGNITTNGVASYPTHIDSLGRGGYMSLPTATERDAIPNLRRKYGMLVFVQADGKIYKLNAPTLTNADWVELSFGSSGSQYTDALARSATSLTVTGSSGAATYSSTTGVFNIPNYTLAGLGGEPSLSTGSTTDYLRGDKTWASLPVYTLSGLGGEPTITAGTSSQYWRGDKTFQTLNTTAVVEGTNLYYTDARSRSAVSLTTTGSSGAATYSNSTGVLNIPNHTLAGLGGSPSSRTITINGTAQDLSADRSWSVGTVTNVNALTLGTTGTDITSSVANGTTSPTITLNIPTASASNRGALSAVDFSTFNAKQSALTFSTGLTNSSNTITVNTSQNIATLSNLTSNGIVTTSGGGGTLSVTSILPVANGGTGATTLTGILKGNGTSAFTTATAGSDYQAPITLTTSGSGVATFSGNTLNIPTVSTSTNASTISGTISVANGGTGSTAQNFVDLTTAQTVSGAKTFIDDFAGDYNNNTKISGFFVTISTQSSTYTLTASDNGKIINFTNAGSVALTLPVLKAGFNCMIIQSGAGVVTLTGSSTTVSNKNSFTKTAGVNSVVTVIYLTTSTAITIGDMSN